MAIDVNTFKARQTMLQKKADLILATAERRDPPGLAEEEKTELTALEKEIDQLTARIAQHDSDAEFRERLDEMTGGRGTKGNGRSSGQMSPRAGSTPGELFVAQTADFFRNGNHRASGAWRSPSIALASLYATTLSEGGGGAPLVLPDVQSGPIPLPTRPLRIADLFGRGQTGSNTVRFMMETTFTNAAAPVAEGAAKPESALAFGQTDEPVRKIAHFLPVTDEMLEDMATIRSYIDARLMLGVQLTEEDQLLNGNGTPPNLLGVLNRPGLTATITQTTEAIADLVAAQITAVSSASNLMPDAIVLNPSDWLKLLTVKASTGEYLAEGAPFVNLNPPLIWGLPAVTTVGIPQKTLLIGNFALGGIVFRHTSGLRVESSNSHQDWFQKNMTAIRAEERIALAIVRASAFGKVQLA